MTSLADAYGGRVAEEVGRRRLTLGIGLFVVGVLLTAVGVVVAATDVLSAFGLDRMAAWRRAGVLAGLGVPAIIGGVFTVMPSSSRVKAAATIGGSVSVLGVALFWYAYPTHWAGYGKDLTLLVTSVYFFGTTASVWAMFVGIANFKRRNNPGGTVSLKVTKGGETRVVEVPRAELKEGGVGGVGLFGSTSGGHVETQTAGPGGPTSTDGATVMEGSSSGGSGSSPGGSTGGSGGGGKSSSRDAGGGTAGPEAPTGAGQDARAATKAGGVSDGGIGDDDITSLKGDGRIVSSTASARDLADRYCGNCEHFRYVRSEQGMEPYCGFHNRSMDDMEACEDWEPNH